MTTAILILVIVLFLWSLLLYAGTYSCMVQVEKRIYDYYDKETVRILTAMYNKDAFVEALERGEEIEL